MRKKARTRAELLRTGLMIPPWMSKVNGSHEECAKDTAALAGWHPPLTTADGLHAPGIQ
jgi:hypothetical protein